MILTNYINTVNALKVAEARYESLKLRREALEQRYCGVHAIRYDGDGTKNQPSNRDNILEYVIAITTPQTSTGMSIDDELGELADEIAELTDTVRKMQYYIKNLQGIEYELYTAMMIDGMRPAEAVQMVAENNYMSEANIWKTYYPQVRSVMKKTAKE